MVGKFDQEYVKEENFSWVEKDSKFSQREA